MSVKCEVCGKTPLHGHAVSHAHNVTLRKFMPNLHRVRVNDRGHVKTIRVCSRCLKAGKVRKA